jgi:PAS domain S-box-containing protein
MQSGLGSLVPARERRMVPTMAEVKVNFAVLPFSERESQILLHAADGLTDKQIAAELGVAAGTIRTYWERLRRKVDARSRGEAIARALRDGFEATLKELAQAQEWSRIMIECSRDYAIFRTDPAGKILSWNPGVTQLLYYSQEEFIGQNISMLFTEVDNAAGMPQMERDVAIQTGRSIDDRWHVRRDGVKVWVEGTLVSLFDGGLEGFAKILQDRTEEYQAKLEVQRLLELTPIEKISSQIPN